MLSSWGERLGEVNSWDLPVAAGDDAGFHSFDSSVPIQFDFEHPLGGDHASILGTGDNFEGSKFNDSGEL